MPGLDPKIVEHALLVDPSIHPKKQKLRWTKPKLAKKKIKEVMKLLKIEFIEVVPYPEWVANIVLILKKDGWV